MAWQYSDSIVPIAYQILVTVRSDRCSTTRHQLENLICQGDRTITSPVSSKKPGFWCIFQDWGLGRR